MSKLNERSFLGQLKSPDSFSLFLLYGPDEYSKEICLNKLISSYDSEPIFFDGQELNFSALFEACCSFSFFSNRKLVCVRNPAVEAFTVQQTEMLYKIISDKPSETCLVFAAKSLEINPRSSSKWAKFIKKIETDGAVVECAEKTSADAVSMIIKTANKKGCSVERDLAFEISERCLNDLMLIDNNLTKLCCYASDKTEGKITADAVDNLVTRRLDFKTYEIAKNILNGNYAVAINILDSLLDNRVEPIAICSALSGSFTDIYRVKIMQENRHSISELSETFDYKGKDYRLRNAGYDAAKCSLVFLREAILLLFEADIALKSTKDNKKTVLEKTLVKIFMQKR